MTVHPGQTLPDGGKARRVYLSLRGEIAAGGYAAGSLLPGETRLAERYEVSRVTVRRALDGLASDGWIEKRLGAGSAVLARPDRAISADISTLMPQLVEMDRTTTVRLLSFSYGPAPDAVATALALPVGARVQRAVRLRLSDGQPFSHLTTHVPEAIAQSYDGTDLAAEPLFRLLEPRHRRRDGLEARRTALSWRRLHPSPRVADDGIGRLQSPKRLGLPFADA
ncbi:MAG: GntR family transcriptional regulator, partial [Pseudomonadota bacterium]